MLHIQAQEELLPLGQEITGHQNGHVHHTDPLGLHKDSDLRLFQAYQYLYVKPSVDGFW